MASDSTSQVPSRSAAQFAIPAAQYLPQPKVLINFFLVAPLALVPALAPTPAPTNLVPRGGMLGFPQQVGYHEALDISGSPNPCEAIEDVGFNNFGKSPSGKDAEDTNGPVKQVSDLVISNEVGVAWAGQIQFRSN
jgi:hypothetical protein